MIHSFAPGKLLLFGEHAAVYGHPAVGCALNQGLTLLWQNQADMEPQTDFSNCVAKLAPEHRELAKAALEIVQRLVPNSTLQNGSLDSESSMCMAGGFGSSAAFATALCRLALLQSSGGLLAPTEIWTMAHTLEKLFHTHPSGIDTGISSHGGTVAFSFFQGQDLPVLTRIASAQLCILYGAVPRQGTSKELIQRIRSQVISADQSSLNALGSLGQIAYDAIQALSSSIDYSSFSHWCTHAQKYLKQLGLANADQDQLFNQAARLGFPGAKLSGAGAGGAFLIAIPDREVGTILKQNLEAYALSTGIPLSCPLAILEF